MAQTAAAHRALGITELLSEIVVHVAQDSLRDVASLCTTNRHFHDVAQNELWRRLDSLHPLLRCFGDECLEYDSSEHDDNPHFRRAPLPAEWERFLANAARVKYLKHQVGEDDIPDEVLNIIAIYRPRLLLLPNIEHLEWVDDAIGYPDISFHAHLFLGPKLKSLDLSKAPSHERTPDFTNIIAILNTVYDLPSRLRSLKLKLDDVVDEDVNKSTAALVRDSDLDVFHGRDIPLPNDAVVHLARSPSLRSAWIALKPGATFSSVEGLLFPLVEYLHITMDDLAEQSVRRLIRGVKSTQLSTLGLTFRREPRHVDLMTFLEELARSHNPLNLYELHLLQDSHRYKELDAQALPDLPDLNISLATLHPILNMNHLVNLEIISPYLVANDHLITNVVECFPLLRRLYLLPGYYSGQAPSATLASLFRAGVCLPHIQELGFPVDVIANIALTIDQYTAVNWTCTRLHVADSPLPEGHIHHVAQFLYSWFRHSELQITASEPHVFGDIAHADERAIYAAQWEECNRIMHPWKWWTPEVSAGLARAA